MHTLIIGSGPAGVTVAETLRLRDAGMDITMLSTEPFPSYSPPAMADYFMTGHERSLYWKGTDVAERLRVDERRGVTVTGIDTAGKVVTLDNGGTIAYDALVIASGSRLHAPLPGVDLPGVHNFKSLVAARRIVERARAHQVRSALIVGCGFIGVEIALLLADIGLDVTVLGRRPWVMPRTLDTETAAVVETALRARRVDVQVGVEADAFVGGREVEGVGMADGRMLTADLYVAATGVKPHVEFLDGSDIDSGWGIRVDDHLRTSAPDVFAAGDVAEAADRMTGERFVHAIFSNAVTQADVAARNILGDDIAYPGAESMNSLKHLGVPVVSVGAMDGERLLRWRHGSALRKVWLVDDRIVGFRLAGEIGGAGALRTLMLRRDDVTRYGDSLALPDFDAGRVVLAAAP
jgi:NAD(P)H-nitrite reductase large subunit